jgi:hypothetical protein
LNYQLACSPTSFADAGDQTLVGQLAKTDPANAKFSIHGSRTATHVAPPLEARRELWRLLLFREF